MSIVGAFDVHRRQLTFEYLDTSGSARRLAGTVQGERPATTLEG
jgi:hypothetical protein